MEQNLKKSFFNNLCKKGQAKRIVKIAALGVLVTSFFAALCAVPAVGQKTYIHALNGSSEIALEQTSGRVLYGDNIHARLPMASTTKVITAIIAIERNDLKKKVKIPKEAVGIEGSSIYLRAEEEMTVEDLLFGLMLMSGNDSAAALAILTAGSIPKFAELMNKKAAELELVNSNFTNPHGLHDANHYTSAYDLARLTAYALNNADFRRIVSSERYVIPDTGSGAGTRYLHNKNKMLRMYEGADGVKTGFTKMSGRCLVSSASRNGMRVVTVVLNRGDMWNDSIRLLNNSFNSYKMTKILSSENALPFPVENGVKSSVRVAPKDRYYPLKNDEQVSYEIENEILRAPVKSGRAVGKIKISLANRLIFEEKMYTMDSIKEQSILDHFKDLLSKKDG